MIKGIITIMSLSLLLSSCSMIEEMQKDWIRRNCNPNGAYNAGLTDGMTKGKTPVANFADSCPSDRDHLNALYLKGFTKGLKSRATEINVTNITRTEKKH